METRPHIAPALIAAAMLLIATSSLPYGYYQFLRWVICGIAVFIAYKSYEWKQAWASWVFGVVAVLFNPLVPVYLTKETWRPIDMFSALLFALSVLLLREPRIKGD
jgi:FtsH-binding integral membrane protein